MRRGLGIVATAPCPGAVRTCAWRGPGSCPGPQRVTANSLLVTPNKNGDAQASTSGGKSLIFE